MKAYEFPVKVTTEGTLEIPPTYAQVLPRGAVVRVIILVAEPTEMQEEKEWTRLTAKEFFAGYEAGDSIYDVRE